ncbi:thioredoxin family protein [Autumnicola musiva]|uniref:Thioredoxin family protein n=1 Tax=Autumnicola musiva TaxID=3075589 RepID=A0ABU3D166_9FLAO|nr:thioredoxin family protein [Zunongwangia sp. F117]MDT0675283.1 thioredoxin family protein [Zunongwangia sp. F117]
MKKQCNYFFIFTLVFSISNAQNSDEINWKTWPKLEQALQNEPKPVFIFFHAEWCAYCKKIEREVFTNKEVIKKINSDYYAVEMDVETTDTISFDNIEFINKQSLIQRNGVHQLPLLLASRNGVPFSLPATVILDRQFAVKKRIFEYYTSKQLLSIL